MNQAYSQLSITNGHITDCKLDSVVYAGVCVVIYQFMGHPNIYVNHVKRCLAYVV